MWLLRTHPPSLNPKDIIPPETPTAFPTGPRALELVG